MGKPKKQTSKRKKGLRRSHIVLDLARKVNGKSPIKIYTTKRESAKKVKSTETKQLTVVKVTTHIAKGQQKMNRAALHTTNLYSGRTPQRGSF